GRPVFERALAVDSLDETTVLRLAASLDQGSEHPLAATIVAAARERGLTLAKVEHFASDAGMGVRGRVDGHQLILGNASLMRREQVDIESQALRAN
ncbi:copper-transporting ATPase, partial [Salmonella sp. gx-f9]|nr:copper-transporting ATPase [Salmonella sp. gx-f9]